LYAYAYLFDTYVVSLLCMIFTAAKHLKAIFNYTGYVVTSKSKYCW